MTAELDAQRTPGNLPIRSCSRSWANATRRTPLKSGGCGVEALDMRRRDAPSKRARIQARTSANPRPLRAFPAPGAGARERRCLTARALLAAAGTCALLGISASSACALNVEVVNDSGQPAQDVYLTLHGGSSNDGQLPEEIPKALSEIHNSTFSLGSFSGRMYVSYEGPYNEHEDGLEAPTRYDKIELTTGGVADVTAVDFFAIPFDLEALNSIGAPVGAALTYRCYTSTILSKLRELAPSAEVMSGGQFLRFLAPKNAWSSYPSMEPYVKSMAGQRIEVEDIYANAEHPPAVNIKYSGTFESNGSITLNGTFTERSGAHTEEHGEALHIEGSTLPAAAYTGNGAYTVGVTAANVGENNKYSVIYRDIVAGFELGYWGGKYGNNTKNWLGKPDFAAARPSVEPYATYNEYAAIINEYSDAYGAAFNELGPTPVTVPLEGATTTLRVTLDPDQGPPACAGASPPPSTAQSNGSASPSTAHSNGSAASSVTGHANAAGAGTVTIVSKAVNLDKRGRALIKLRCTGGPCTGDLTLGQLVNVKRPSHKAARGRRKQTNARTVLLGSARFSIAAGKTQSVLVSLSKNARRSVSVAGRRGLVALATATMGTGPKAPVAARRSLTLKPYTPPPRAGRR
jgi:hypothetical protein